MKPTKNRIFCVDAHRAKMLFDSEGSAKRFIKFNTDDMENSGCRKVPKRAYFCIACGGWHVTSQEQVPTLKSKVEMYFDKQKDNKDKNRQIKQIINDIVQCVRLGDKMMFLVKVDELKQFGYRQTGKIVEICEMLEPVFDDSGIKIEELFKDISDGDRLYPEMRRVLKLIKQATLYDEMRESAGI